VDFLSKSDDAVLARIRASGFQACQLADDAGILQALMDRQPDIIIFDKLDVSEALAARIRQALPAARLVIFTNITDANRHAHVAVTADIGSRFENQRYIDERTGTLTFFGPRYWVMRPEFGEFHRRGKAIAARTQRFLLIFGGSDPANLTPAVLEQLLALERSFDIDVVLGGHFPHEQDLARVLAANEAKRGRVFVHRNIANVAELMHRADLVLASPGLSAFEALRVGTPVIVVPHNALQRDTYRGFMRMLEREELGKLGEMIENGDCTRPDDAHIVRIQIGQGVEELKEAIMSGATERKP
jgi:spore coat polysaccharide biosynthesis predicted glycosyltransferase SpsG